MKIETAALLRVPRTLASSTENTLEDPSRRVWKCGAPGAPAAIGNVGHNAQGPAPQKPDPPGASGFCSLPPASCHFCVRVPFLCDGGVEGTQEPKRQP